MERFDTIVVGAGASGLTAATLLATAGHQVALVERAPRLGGSLAGFTRGGLPFDSGLHFTGGLDNGGLLHEMLRVLDLADDVTATPLDPAGCCGFLFEDCGKLYTFPRGLAALEAYLAATFPGEAAAVARYFEALAKVRRATGDLRLREMIRTTRPTDHDFVSLQDVLDSLTGDAHLQALLGSLCMCHGSCPREISFAAHARVCIELHDSVVKIVGGGDALVAAWQRRLADLGVRTMANTWIDGCLDVHHRRVGRFRLNTGAEIAADNVVLTVHPRTIAEILPDACTTPAFRRRVDSFAESAGFFSVYGRLTDLDLARQLDRQLITLLPDADVNAALDPAGSGPSAVVLIGGVVPGAAGDAGVLTLLEVARPAATAAWRDTASGRRPAEYHAYKAARAAAIVARLRRWRPEVADCFELLDTASMLTYRDYLHSPFGSAYGIRQRVAQVNVSGRLPVHGMYAAGQSALLPGLMGAMASSFMVCREILGEEPFDTLCAGRLAS